jgi:dTDP-4-dehydrorhamnose 3,5-epimerase-like enzyme
MQFEELPLAGADQRLKAVSDAGGDVHCHAVLFAQLDASEVFYQITERYVPGSSAGVRWDDPAFGIHWPIRPPILSERDAGYADYCKVAADE